MVLVSCHAGAQGRDAGGVGRGEGLTLFNDSTPSRSNTSTLHGMYEAQANPKHVQMWCYVSVLCGAFREGRVMIML